MSMSTGNGGGSGEPIPRYTSVVGPSSSLPDRRRRGKNFSGNYYANTGPRGGDGSGGRYQGSSYQRNYRGGGNGDGPHNGNSNYHYHRDYDSQAQQQPHSQSPTDSHTSSRSGSHQHQGQQGSMNHSNVQQHYHQQQHNHHQYHQQKQDYESSGGRHQEYRSRGSGGGDERQHYHHNSHYNNHHHRNNAPTPQQQHSDTCPVAVSGQNSHASGYATGNGSASSSNHQSLANGSTVPTEIVVVPPPSSTPEHTYSATPNSNGNGGSQYQQQPNGPTAAAVISQFPPGMTSVPPPGPPATVGFYGYHPNSQPMLGSLALCHIPYGVNPSSVISPVVYTQIIGSGVLTPGLPYNFACGIPTPFLQPSGAAPLIFQPPPQQQHPQAFSHPSQYPHHFHQNPGQFAVAGHPMINTGSMPHHHSTPTHHQSHQSVGSSAAAGEDCVLFDSSSLLNPDADAFFPPAFPPSSLEDDAGNAEASGELGVRDGIVVEEEPIVIVDEDDDDEEEDIDPVDGKPATKSNREESGSALRITPHSQEDGDDEEDQDAENELDAARLENEGDRKSPACDSGNSNSSKNDGSGDGNESD